MRLLKPAGISDVPLPVVEKLVLAADSAEAEGIFISCTALPTLAGLPGWEERLQKPVFSANLATIWLELSILGLAVRDIGVALSRK